MWPFLYNTVEYLPGTLGGAQLAMAIESIVWNKFLEPHALSDEQLTGSQLLLSWMNLDVGADERDTYTIHIIAQSMCALVVPAASLVDQSIAADKEIVANVIPIPAIHVKALHHTHPSLADILG